MDIGKINNNYVNNTISETKSKTAQDDFEKQLKSAMSSNDDKQLKSVCKQFEGIMLSMMYKEMKATVPQDDLMPQDSGKDIFDSMLDDKLMDQASQSNGIGLADILYKQLSTQLKATYKPTNGGEDTGSVQGK